MTNGDRIRQMSNEELAKVIKSGCSSCIFRVDTCDVKGCEEGIKAYLESEVE
jgi:hypothetical protein